ncbi:MAG: hypothetical protein HDS77_06640 [Bacteroidales bacterium]|nr:hypothetical protein [Bacteroidales bacterium]MBD5257648.1 hypothetical protein [Barnesiella sp.]
MRTNFLYAVVITILLAACNTNDKYDSTACQNFIDKYSYEISFFGNSNDYNTSLKNIPQKEYSEMICQLKGIINKAHTELTEISEIKSITEMREQYIKFNDNIMLRQYKYLYGIVDDANYRDLLDDNNKKAYDELQQITEKVANLDIKIKQLTR